MAQKMKKILYSSTLILLSGCVSSLKQPIPVIQYYSAPQPSTQTATIIGNIYERKYLADSMAFVLAVDQQKIINPREQLKQPLNLEAGKRDLQIWCQKGSFKYTNLITVDVEAGKHYQVGYELNTNGQYGCHFWIYDLDNKKAIGELVAGAEIGKYSNPNQIKPITHLIDARPTTNHSYTVPIRVINKMGSR